MSEVETRTEWAVQNTDGSLVDGGIPAPFDNEPDMRAWLDACRMDGWDVRPVKRSVSTTPWEEVQ